MHRVLVPRLSGIHRFACLALYRALLRQCARLGSSTALENATVRFLVQQRFYRYKNLQSPSQTSNALKAGYEALDLLCFAAKGNERSINRIATLISEFRTMKRKKDALQKAMTEAKPVRLPSLKQQKKQRNVRFQEITARRHPDATPILSRPRPVVSGKRRVPVLVNARGIPFLRIKKPQPKSLSGMLRNKLDRRWKRIKHRERLDTDILFAEDEDLWDDLTVRNREPVSWLHAVQRSRSEVSRKLQEEDSKNKKMAEAMWDVVLAERKLAAEEEEQSLRQKEPTEQT